MEARKTADDSTHLGPAGPIVRFLTTALAAAALGLATPASADDLFVVNDLSDLVDANLVDPACRTSGGTCTLRAAVMQANVNPGHSAIHLPPGLYALSLPPNGANGDTSGDLNITKSTAEGWISIDGAGKSATIVDGGALDRVLRVESGADVVIQNLTLRNGNAGYGGGLLVEGELTLGFARVTGNVAEFSGGGLSLDSNATLIVDFTEFVANQAAWDGGGIYLAGAAGGFVYFRYGELRDNVAERGGGLFQQGPAEVDLSHSAVSGNQAFVGGGLAFLHESATIYLRSITVDDNHATSPEFGYGGGILSESTIFVVNGTISGNSAALDGGGLFNGGNATLYNTTVAFNEADADADPNGGRGGGVFSHPAGVFAIRNSVLAGNNRSGAPVPDDCRGAVGSYGHNRFGSFDGCTITQTGACGGSFQLLGSMAELGPLRFNGGPTRTHAIQPGSGLIDDVDAPCVCQNWAAQPIGLDQRGGPRVVGPRCDVGAFELGALPAGSIFADGFEFGGTGMWD